MDDEFADDTLLTIMSVFRRTWSKRESKAYALGLQMCSAKTMMVLVKIHHLEATELIGDSLDSVCLSFCDLLYSFSVPN